MPTSLLVVAGLAVLGVALGSAYFRRFEMTLPPAGVINLPDVVLMLVGIVLVPYLYLALPGVAVAVIVGGAVLGILYFTLEPVLRAGWAAGLVAVALVAGDVALAFGPGVASVPFLVLNNAVLLLAVTGVTNLWTQSGVKARDVTVLAAALAVYDWVATVQLTVMEDLIGRLSSLPFVPLLAWGVANPEEGLGAGLGDMLLATLFPLVMRKAFGRAAAWVAALLGIAAVVTMLALAATGVVTEAIPAMVVMGPLMVAQYLGWRRARGGERTTRQYLRAEPLARRA